MQPSSSSTGLDDNAIKASIRHFALRVCQSCAIVDSTAWNQHRKHKPGSSQPSTSSKAPCPMTAWVLEACSQRQAIMEELHCVGLGDMKEAKRRQGSARRCMEFHRHPLMPTIPAAFAGSQCSRAIVATGSRQFCCSSQHGRNRRVSFLVPCSRNWLAMQGAGKCGAPVAAPPAKAPPPVASRAAPKAGVQM